MYIALHWNCSSGGIVAVSIFIFPSTGTVPVEDVS
jgi:uncharacterized membrane protein